MKPFYILFAVIAFAGLVGSVVAARASEIEVNLERSRLDFSEVSPKNTASKPTWVAMGVSSWAPRHFSLPGQIGGESVFTNSVPAVYGNILLPFSTVSNIKAKLGLGFLGLTRTAQLNSGGIFVPATQTIGLMSLRVGAEYTPRSLLDSALVPYVGASLLPSYAISGRSIFDNGSVYFGIPVEIATGARMNLRSMGIPVNNADFDLGLLGTVGSVKGSSVAGLGINGGILVRL